MEEIGPWGVQVVGSQVAVEQPQKMQLEFWSLG